MATVGAVTVIDLEIESLERWLDELDILRDGVALALSHRRLARDTSRFPDVEVAVTVEVTPSGRVQRRRRHLSVKRRPPASRGAVSWWTTASATGFTEAALRDHRERWATSTVAAMVDGAKIS